MEPIRGAEPDADFLKNVKESLHKVGALLIFDEITIGWRYCFGGAHLAIGVDPDIAVFAKALGNGHPIGAVIGTRAAMYGAEDSFISSTYWTESVGPVAALATLKKMEETRAWEYVWNVGKATIDKWNELAEKHDLPAHAGGIACLAHLDFKKFPLEMKTLYTVLMLEEGFLGNTGFYPSLSHTDEIMEKYFAAVDRVFEKMAK
jgi:glutamate-1-semialdehyde aminotransferase